MEPIPALYQRLSEAARGALEKGLAAARAGRLVSKIGRAIEQSVRGAGFSIVQGLHGHGTGRTIHEEPSVPNFRDPLQRDRLSEGLVITIEPMITSGSGEVFLSADGWTVKTRDRAPAAHWEHTLIVGRSAPLIVTA